ncbi:MAG: branched-chain amino acid ABC transporter permease [Lautropia sp.]
MSATPTTSTASTAPAAAAGSADALPKLPIDPVPLLLIPAIMLLAWPLVGSTSSWVTLTVAGLAMGMMIFVMASGLSLIFGLMDVLNFAHGAFITVGAYVAVSTLRPLAGWMSADSVWMNAGAVLLALAAAGAVGGLLGWFFERVIVRPVYGQHLKQILITMGGLIVAEQLIHVIWGPDLIALAKPATFRGAVAIGPAAVERYRLIAVGLGAVIFIAMMLILNRTRLGLLIRAGVEDREMVEALGYRIGRVFIGVFVAGAALAGLGGTMWAIYEESVRSTMGAELMIMIFIVVIIGGLGSVGGCFVAALLVGLTSNYIGFVAPKVALGSSILLMLVVLMWRPSGLYPVAKR